MSDLWVLAPVYNEEKNLSDFVEEWLAVLRKTMGADFTFCLINDGSTDGSPDILNRLAATHPELKIIDKPHSGHGPTCRMGYELALQAEAQWIFQIDSDGQCDPAFFETFWGSRSHGPVHYGVRRAREDGWIRRFISRALTVLIFLLSFRWVRDANVPYRLMRRDALEAALRQMPKNFRMVNALLALIQQRHPGIQWHVIPFHRRTGRQLPVDLPFFLGQAGAFIIDYLFWRRHREKKIPEKKSAHRRPGVTDPLGRLLYYCLCCHCPDQGFRTGRIQLAGRVSHGAGALAACGEPSLYRALT